MIWKPIDTAPIDGQFLVCDKDKEEFAVVYKHPCFGMKPSGVQCDSHYDITLSFEPYYWKWVK